MPDLARAGALIDAVHLDDPASVSALDAILFTEQGAEAARERLEAGVSGDALWAATHVYVANGTDPAPLLPLLGNGDATVRALAAAGLVSLGRAEGFDVLAASITSEAGIRAAHPPLTVAQFAAASLSRYTGNAVPRGPTGTPEERTALAAAWTSWLADHRGRLVFDAAERLWSVS